MEDLKIYRMHPSVYLPRHSTEDSACFDIQFNPAYKNTYKGYNKQNSEFNRTFSDGTMIIMPGDRIMVPTGLVLDIPKGFSVRLHPRSGLSLKNGLVLANSEAVIDSDYTEELFVLLTNMSESKQIITVGDRLAQGELVAKQSYKIVDVNTSPTQKTDRIGGFGSTGINTVLVLDRTVEQQAKSRGRPRKIQDA